jgi:hypothetical protein
MLHSHPAVKAYEELFLLAYKEKPTWVGAKDVATWNAYWTETCGGIKKFLRPYFCFNYLQGFYSLLEDDRDVVGFKLMYSQVRHYPEILAYLVLNRVSIIHLIRSNFLNVILSKEANQVRGGVPHSRTRVERVQIHLDTSTLLKRLNWQKTKIKWAKCIFSHLGVPYREIIYEELVVNQERFNGLLEFLGVDSNDEPLNSSLRKLNKGTHQELIENYDEVAALLAGTEYAQLLD